LIQMSAGLSYIHGSSLSLLQGFEGWRDSALCSRIRYGFRLTHRNR
jgi:hypothetical protein